MKKFILITLASVSIFALTGCIQPKESDCPEICINVVTVCDSYTPFTCVQACADRSKQQKECAKNASSCIDIENECRE